MGMRGPLLTAEHAPLCRASRGRIGYATDMLRERAHVQPDMLRHSFIHSFLDTRHRAPRPRRSVKDPRPDPRPDRTEPDPARDPARDPATTTRPPTDPGPDPRPGPTGPHPPQPPTHPPHRGGQLGGPPPDRHPRGGAAGGAQRKIHPSPRGRRASRNRASGGWAALTIPRWRHMMV